MATAAVAGAQIGMDIYGGIARGGAISDLEAANEKTFKDEEQLLTEEYTHQMAQTQGEISAQAGAAGMAGGKTSGVTLTAKNAADYLSTVYNAQKEAIEDAIKASKAGASAMQTSNFVDTFDLAIKPMLSLAGQAFSLFAGPATNPPPLGGMAGGVNTSP